MKAVRRRTERGGRRRALEGEAALRSEVRRWAAKIGVRPRRVQIRPMTTKWASCTSAGRIAFSRELLGKSRGFREFVIVHELLHLLVPNHGKLLKSLLNAYLPRWARLAPGQLAGPCRPESPL